MDKKRLLMKLRYLLLSAVIASSAPNASAKAVENQQPIISETQDVNTNLEEEITDENNIYWNIKEILKAFKLNRYAMYRRRRNRNS